MYALKFFTCVVKVSPKITIYAFSTKSVLSNSSKIVRPIYYQRSLKLYATTTKDSKDNKKESTVVYVGPLSKQIRNVKMFSFISSMAGLFSQPYVYTRAVELNMSTGLLITICSIMGVFTFITPLLLHYVTKKYVTSMEYDPSSNMYTAITYSLFLRFNRLDFKPGEAHLPDTPAMFSSVNIKGTPLLVDPKFFEDIEHYKKIMGFDKPMDFKLGPSN